MLTPQTQPPSSFVPPVQPPSADKSNRRIQRIALPLPIRIEVKLEKDSSWSEVTRLTDVSAFGAGFSLKRPIKRGRLIMVTIPMPRQLRSFDYGEPQYKVWGLVRRCIPVGTADKPEFAIGVAFTGKQPPEGFAEYPSRLYDLIERAEESSGFWHLTDANLHADESALPRELRKQTRYFIPEPVKLEQVDEAGNVHFAEATVTENLSLGGAAVFSSLKATAGTFMRVTSERFNVQILSVVRGTRIGSDGITRLHLEFIDRLFPLEGVVADA